MKRAKGGLYVPGVKAAAIALAKASLVGGASVGGLLAYDAVKDAGDVAYPAAFAVVIYVVMSVVAALVWAVVLTVVVAPIWRLMHWIRLRNWPAAVGVGAVLSLAAGLLASDFQLWPTAPLTATGALMAFVAWKSAYRRREDLVGAFE